MLHALVLVAVTAEWALEHQDVNRSVEVQLPVIKFEFDGELPG